ALLRAEALDHVGRSRETIATVREVVGTLPPGSPMHANALAVLGGAELEVGDFVPAIATLEQAMVERADDPIGLADVRFMLARALLGAHRDRPRAISLAEQARAAWTNRKGSEHALPP